MPAWEHSSESGSLYLHALYRYHVIIYKQRMFLVQSNLFFLFLFFLFIIYSTHSLAPLFFFPSLSLSIRKQHIYIYFFFRTSLPPSSARIEPYHSLTIMFVYAVSRRDYTLMKKGLFTINSPRALSHSSLCVNSTSAYIRFTHVFSFIAVWCTPLYVYLHVYMCL